MAQHSKSKIYVFDIETSYNEAYVFGKWNQNVQRYKKEWELLSFAFKELGEKKVTVYSRRTLSEKQLVKKLWKLLNNADIVITQNGDKFDIRKANAKFIQFKLPPPSPYESVDTRKVSKKVAAFNSNSLDDLGRLLGFGRKIENEGPDFWIACGNGNKKALREMEIYNCHDVVLTEKWYLWLRPWVKNHPDVALFYEKIKKCRVSVPCQACGSLHTNIDGYKRLTNGWKTVFRCTNCGHYSRSKLRKCKY